MGLAELALVNWRVGLGIDEAILVHVADGISLALLLALGVARALPVGTADKVPIVWLRNIVCQRSWRLCAWAFAGVAFASGLRSFALAGLTRG